MKKHLRFTALLSALLLLFAGCSSRLEQPIKPLARVDEVPLTETKPAPENATQGAIDFSASLFAQAAQQEPGNFILSPLSAYLALAMASAGAQGQTLTELETALGGSIDNITALANGQVNRYNGDYSIVSSANSIWLDDRFTVNQEYVNTLLSSFAAESFPCTLSTSETRDAINAWVSEHTNGLIDRLLEENLSRDARIALINTLAMKADWATQFVPEDTCDALFTTDDGSQATVSMMMQKGSYAYLALPDGGQAVVLPYADCDLAMLAILPPQGVTGTAYAASLPDGLLQDCLAAPTCDVLLRLPRFEAETSLTLNAMLQAMGIEKAFTDDGSADFSGMCVSTDEKLYISKVLQKAKITVGEKGTEAVAATAVIMEKMTAMLDPIVWTELNFDRSFVYAIVDTQSTLPLFLGVEANPA